MTKYKNIFRLIKEETYYKKNFVFIWGLISESKQTKIHL